MCTKVEVKRPIPVLMCVKIAWIYRKPSIVVENYNFNIFKESKDVQNVTYDYSHDFWTNLTL